MRAFHALVTGLVALGLAACGSGNAPETTAEGYDPDNQDTWPMSELVDHHLDLATANSASTDQIRALEEAAEVGEVTYAAFRQANENVRNCVVDAGGTVGEMEDYNSRGIMWIGFEIVPPSGADTDQWFLLYNDCYDKHLSYLASVYSAQPASREALTRALEQHDEALRRCLTDAGGIDIDELTTDGLYLALQDQSFAPEKTGYSDDVDCLMSVGINW